MNIILLDSLENRVYLGSGDERAIHIVKTLRMVEGDELFVGYPNGPKGKAVIESVSEEGLMLRVSWGEVEDRFLPIELIVGMSRPQTMRKVLQECTSLGVRKIVVFQGDKSEASYGESKLWVNEEWKRYVRLGVEQAFVTLMPEVVRCEGLEDALWEVQGRRLALDNYEAEGHLRDEVGEEEVALAIGGERGWSRKERDVLRGNGYRLVNLGKRVLRVETAAAVAVGLIGV